MKAIRSVTRTVLPLQLPPPVLQQLLDLEQIRQFLSLPTSQLLVPQDFGNFLNL
jgi:hypothetical protein